ncbi:TAF5-like RNA polymerase II p300/CBP-associated factor-associated factor 65 kDa subunit 5L isoform X2 [Dreissena polymorpha]|uniref:TAF5-like RNA polymerase II p300/CBP-associated factor-associated factor 65 kDa subunit 5L isoform X2 n=1 Tax=Dreissena polymorpha TaxID=45954 RepID=UPI002264858A|nr:TAF5-like RNA polymerase II p300/CBP-associated factor-associated factor 65 kDa subunit 5L isoform X2 [Dreissena polymorpha]
MKKTKHEHLLSTISGYLKRRHFSEGEPSQKKECKGHQPLPNMALKGSQTGEATTTNTLAFSSISGDTTLIEQQYIRLRTFLQENMKLFGTDSQALLFPVFVHMYLEMLSNGHRGNAHKFFKSHCAIFGTDTERQSILEQLSKLSSKADMISCKHVQAFKDMKYRVPLTKEKFEILHRYLKKDDNMMLLQIINHNIHLDGVYSSSSTPFEQGNFYHQFIHLFHCFNLLSMLEVFILPLPRFRTEPDDALSLVEDKTESRPFQPISPAVIPDNKVVRDDAGLTNLKQVIKAVRDGPPGLPSICFYSFLNAHQGLCCASTSADKMYLSGGFEDSAVKLWRLLPGSFPSVDNSDGPSVIRIAADYLNTAEEEEIRSKHRLSGEEVECVTLRGHTGAVYQARFTWDSNFLLTCSDDTTVRLWDIEKQTNAAVYKGHNYPVWDVDSSDVGDYFASCSHDQTAKLWSTERTFPLRSFVGHSYDVDCVRFHPNNNYIATGSGDKTVRMWSIQEGKSVRLLSGHKSSVLAVAFSPNGTMLASAGEDRRVRVWDLRTGTPFKEFRGHTDVIYTLSFNQSSSMLASGGLDNCIRIWDLSKNASSVLSSDNHNSAELLGAFPTKSTPVVYLNFTDHNVLQAAGAV